MIIMIHVGNHWILSMILIVFSEVNTLRHKHYFLTNDIMCHSVDKLKCKENDLESNTS